ncbi:hypothetical protein BBF96_10870 [Anoxybacter fermentans]|uniref:Uncharacterized protein n=1 Tax=Anoxybacter fermentans TaxID=1323375 RepID=A0A3S9SZW1_9FIRM|nr:hypothetical protein [Anoxybacter fermentans]AZR73844.1 hypothetical protein BBF96_10870 [Anoxybacter fermentans]
MSYILYFIRGGRQVIDNVVGVHPHRRKITFVFTNGAKLEVIKEYLLHYELIEDVAVVNKEDRQDLFDHFDHFVSKFINKVEGAVKKTQGTLFL